MEELLNKTLDAFLDAERGRVNAEIKVLELKKEITILLKDLSERIISITELPWIDIKWEIIDMINKILD